MSLHKQQDSVAGRLRPPGPELGTRPEQPTRVRWWAVALPLTVFVTLLCLLASPAQAGGAQPSPFQGLERIEYLLPQILISLFA